MLSSDVGMRPEVEEQRRAAEKSEKVRINESKLKSPAVSRRMLCSTSSGFGGGGGVSAGSEGGRVVEGGMETCSRRLWVGIGAHRMASVYKSEEPRPVPQAMPEAGSRQVNSLEPWTDANSFAGAVERGPLCILSGLSARVRAGILLFHRVAVITPLCSSVLRSTKCGQQPRQDGNTSQQPGTCPEEQRQ